MAANWLSLARTKPKPAAGERSAISLPDPPWWVLWVLSGVVTVCLACFGYNARSLYAFLVEWLLGVASLAVGGLIGFLFGIPRAAAGLHRTQQDEAAPRESMADNTWQPSTNLEQVADWLTKILVGVGLTQFARIGGGLAEVGQSVASSQPTPGIAVVSQLVVVIFAILGFIASFLWTRIKYQGLQVWADSSLRRMVEEVRRNQTEQAKVTELLATGTLHTQASRLATPPDATAGLVADSALAKPGWPAELSEKVQQFKDHSHDDYDCDPTADLFPALPMQANGRQLEVVIAASLQSALAIKITLRRKRGAALDKPVTFLLHPTFQESVVSVDPVKDEATLTIYSEGWFTVVAIADDGATQLSYPLNELPGAPEWFKEN